MIISAIIMVLSLCMLIWGTKLSVYLKVTDDANRINAEVAAITFVFFIIFIGSLFYIIKHIV